jgi:hypothetical protein
MVQTTNRTIRKVPFRMETLSVWTALQNFPKLPFGHETVARPNSQDYRSDARAKDSIFDLF